MPYSIPGFTKILIYIYFGDSIIIFILVGTLCVRKFAYGARSVHFTVSPRKRRYIHSSCYTFSCTITKKIKNPLCDNIIMARSLLNWKTTQTTEKD